MLNNSGKTLNPLDRNNDGKVDLKDLTGRPGNLNETQGLNSGLAGNARHNPLDRNYDGKVDLKDLTGQPTYASQGLNQGFNANQGLNQGTTGFAQSSSLNDPFIGQGSSSFSSGNVIGQEFVRAAPTKLEQVEKDVVIHEHIHPIEKEEIQPVVFREREQLEIRQITQQLHETQIQPTLIQARELAPEIREAIVERAAPIQENVILPTIERDATLRSQVVHAPIVNETIKRTIIEEIQPVLERDIIQSTVIQETKNIYEKVVEAPVVFRESRVVESRGIVTGGSLEALAAQGFNLGQFHSGTTVVQPIAGQGFNQGMNQGIHHNPLDRNYDGKVDLKDLTGQPGYNQGMNQGLNQGLTGSTHHNPLDRNFDGRVDSKDLTGQPGYSQGLNQPLAGQGLNQGLTGSAHHNPLDRNYDGKVDLKDLTGQPGYNQGLNQPLSGQGLTGSSVHHNPLDRNFDGKVDLKDLAPGSSNKAAPLNSQAPLRTL